MTMTMICSKCGTPDINLAEGTFKPTGNNVEVPGLRTNVKEYKFTCRECLHAIDTTSKEPEIPETEW